ncbi:HD domain-containing protein [Xanthocytophaga agilis]|uniref:HD domain-containing protein n=1 Tax=Xanthocytophaga agilis TaxID=3048010 RepID=A0AAE3UCD1_9BACT|nr:HD domain-containing protein [Xanthocytophaga agilis]MDJ1499995.1 HD domain-containing protein [Xanthocytophaga agilis]
MFFTEEIYYKAMNFAGEAHHAQFMPGSTIPYVTHLANVCMEVVTALTYSSSHSLNGDLLVCSALLHDVLEDTPVSYTEVEALFGTEVAKGVAALTRNTLLPEAEQIPDSLQRILRQPVEIRMVKMADRIDNLRQNPLLWSNSQRKAYQNEAQLILKTLGGCNLYLEEQLKKKINSYNQYLEVV